MKFFAWINTATEKAINAAKLPGLERKLNRSLEAATDSMRDEIINLEEKIEDRRKVLCDLDSSADNRKIAIQKILEYRLDIQHAEQCIEYLEAETTHIFQDVPEE